MIATAASQSAEPETVAFACDDGTARQSHKSLARLVESPAEVADHAIAWGCIADGAPPLKTRIVAELGHLRSQQVPEDEVWLLLGVPTEEHQAQVVRRLSSDEEERASRFRFERDRWCYSAAHSLLRIALAASAGCEPEALEFETGESGKPFLRSACGAFGALGSTHFNISHTRGLVAVAMARYPVGVDVEQVRPVAEMRDLVIELMSENALSRFDAAAGETAKTDLFMRYWTLSEAYLKASGEGLVGTTRDLDFSAQGLPRLLGPVGERNPGWQFGHAHGDKANWNWARGASERAG